MGKHKQYIFKKELGIKNKDVAKLFEMSEMGFANSTAKDRYLNALSRFYEYIKEHEPKETCR
jgi:hypothetical protein